MAQPTPPPVAIAGPGLAPSTLADSVKAVLSLKVKADSILVSPALEQELAEGTQGPQSAAARIALQQILAQPEPSSKLSRDELARTHFVKGWALGRVGEYDGTKPENLPALLEQALEEYAKSAELMRVPQPPRLGETPSVTRPKPGQSLPSDMVEQPAWVGELLAEWARTQTTLAFSQLLVQDNLIDQDLLASLLDLAVRRNVQGQSGRAAPVSQGDR